MKWIGLAGLAALAGCHGAVVAPAPRPLMEPALAAKLCTNPGAVSAIGFDCVMRDQRLPARLLPQN